jgi:D-cysteine desulfhydrase
MSDASRPLFRKFPALETTVPRAELGRFPTPVQHLPDLGREIGNAELWVKRDDLTNPDYGGNKVRKLEFLLGEALARGCRRVVTMGGFGTNHGLATAAFCNRLGLACDLVLFPQPVTAHCLQSIKLFHKHEARLHYSLHFVEAMTIGLGLVAKAAITGDKAMFVPAGGSSPLGTLGFVNAAFELEEQVLTGQLPEPEVIVCAVGSCGTLAGLLVGSRFWRLKSRLVGVRVTPGMAANCTLVSRLANKALALLMRADGTPGPRVPASAVVVKDDYYGGGYGVVSEASRRCVELAGSFGLRLETTYTGKAFAAVCDEAAANPGRGPILFWDTFGSADHSAEADGVDIRGLPRRFRRLFEKA